MREAVLNTQFTSLDKATFTIESGKNLISDLMAYIVSVSFTKSRGSTWCLLGKIGFGISE